MTNTGHYLAAVISWLIEGRSNKIFCMLFGVSFYLILRRPEYPSLRFIWRCILLSLFGLFNLLFYSSDVLLWYGIMGAVLTIFRKCSPRALLFAFLGVFILSFFTPTFTFSNVSVFGDRYSIDHSLLDIIKYPLLYGYSMWFVSIPLLFLAYFILGYCLAKNGILENLSKYANNRNIVILLIVNCLLIIASWLNRQIINIVEIQIVVKPLIDFFGAFLYILIFFKIYFKYHTYTIFRYLESYGRLGLTNYSFQGILGVIVSLYIVMPFKISYEYAIMLYLTIYIIQMIFSYYWLKYFKNGPLEWFWRCLTSMRFTNPLIDKCSTITDK